MSLVSRLSPRFWIIVLILACSLLIWINSRRAEHVRYVSSLAGQPPAVEAAASAASRSGDTSVLPALIVPERSEVSFNWLAQTHQMLVERQWRLRHIDSDNAPFGRDTQTSSPYRWWLGFLAWLDHTVTARPLWSSLEGVALYAEPLQHLVLLIGATIFVAWRFGVIASCVLAIGLVTMFPFAAGFLPGVPDSHGLSRSCALGSLLLLLAGLRSRTLAPRWFACAGVLGGLGMWIDIPTQLPILAGVSLGALSAALTARRLTKSNDEAVRSAPWRIWAAAGAATILVTYLVEYFPVHLGSWRLESIHPIYGVAWLGIGKLLDQLFVWGQRRRLEWSAHQIALVALAVAALVTVPISIFMLGRGGWFATDVSSLRLTNQPGGIVAASFRLWLARDGFSATVWATLLPLVIVILALWLFLRRATTAESRECVGFAFGPVLVALGFASRQLNGWHLLDIALLVLMIATTAAYSVTTRRSALLAGIGCAVTIALFACPGLIQLIPRKADSRTVLTASEAQELIERDLARWLAKHSNEPRPIVFAPPHETTTLCFYGGLRGVGTFDPENTSGLGASLMITGARTMEEVQAAIQVREIRYVVIPSWDPFFDEFARLYLVKSLSNRMSFFVGELRRWALPLWLRPVAYQMPVIPGFENQSVLVFEVVDEQSPATAASRLTEYFLETGRVDQALSASEALRRFPGDVGALAAQAQLLSAREDASGLAVTMRLLLSRLSTGADRYLPWDRRVSVAAVLAQNNQLEIARPQLQRCLKEITEKKLRALSPGALFKFLVLGQAFKTEIADPKVRALAMELLSPELRAQL